MIIQTQKNCIALLFLAVVSILLLQPFTARAQGTAFTYQGRLDASGASANGNYDFRFRLAADPLANNYVGSPYATNAVPVAGGLFTVTVDFGAGIFGGSNYWLEVDLKTNGAAGYTVLSPLQAVTPSPYAVFANTASNLSGLLPAAQINGTVSSGNIAGVYGNAVALNNAANSFTGAFNGNGANVSNVNATALSGLSASNFWQLGGNSVASRQFIGSTNPQPVEIWAGGARAMRFEPNADNAPNLIGGSSNNYVANGVVGATIGGGGATNYSGTQYSNSVAGDFGTVSGGLQNFAGGQYSFVGGGLLNSSDIGIIGTTVGGGVQNTNSAEFATVGGGSLNIATVSGWAATVSGGYQNTANGTYGTIGGGLNNYVGGGCATVSGGMSNVASGNYSFAAGYYARAFTQGAFVWADSQGSAFNSTNNDTFNVRVQGGAHFVTSGAGMTIDGFPVLTGSGSTTLFNTNGAPDVILGSPLNYAANGVIGATVGGGGATNVQGGPPYRYTNGVTGNFGTVSGGAQNVAGTFSFVGGGYGNSASGYSATVSGGGNSTASGSYSTVPGGAGNIASGDFSFAVGSRAQAANQGAFVWADSQGTTFSSTANDQFLVRAQGGVGINNSNPNGASLFVAGNRSGGFANATSWLVNSNASTTTAPALRVLSGNPNATNVDGALSVSISGQGLIAEFGNNSAWVAAITNDGTIYSKGLALTSDRNAKENFAPLDAKTVLSKVVAMPVTEWNYRDDAADKKHIGPVAQDFEAAFGLNGGDDRHISVVDESGVALAAIQGLNQKVNELSAALKQRDAENAELKTRLARLEQFMQGQESK